MKTASHRTDRTTGTRTGTEPEPSTLRSLGVIGARTLPSRYAEKVGDIVDDLLGRGYHIASGGADGADQFVIERLLHRDRSCSGTIYSAWKHFGGFPVKVRAMHRQFADNGGAILWGLSSGKEPLPLVRTALLARNVRLVDACYGVVVFLTKESRGSVFTLKKAVLQHKPMVVFPVDCELPVIPSVKWKKLICGGIWENGYKALYLK